MSQAGKVIITSPIPGELDTLTGNTGGAVGPSGAGNINVVGDGTTITVAGNPGTNTLTISRVGGGGTLNTLTGNSGAATASSGNINVTTANATVTFAGSSNNLLQDFAATTNLTLGSAMPSLTSGVDNTGLGVGALASVTTGSSNTAVGYNALNATVNAAGDGNTAVGWGALKFMSSGSGNNTAIGFGAGESLLSGQYNVFVGEAAGTGLLSTGSPSSNIFIGTSGGGHERAGLNNTLIIGNETGTGVSGLTAAYICGISGVNVGSTATVVTENNDQLGTAVITGGTGINIATSANTITINAFSPASFSAYLHADLDAVTGDDTHFQVVFESTEYNTGSGYSTSTGLFTAPTTGHYLFGSTIYMQGAVVTNGIGQINLYKNGVGIAATITYANPYNITASNGLAIYNGTVGLALNAGDEIYVDFVVYGNATKNINILGYVTSGDVVSRSFWGYQVA